MKVIGMALAGIVLLGGVIVLEVAGGALSLLDSALGGEPRRRIP